MTAVAELERIEIPRNAIDPNDRADFELIRSEVYGQTKASDPVRRERLTELADLVLSRGAPDLSIHQAVLAARGSNEHLSKGIGYIFTLDLDGNVVGIDRVSHLPQDMRAIESARRAAARIGWAPKQNETSFRVRNAKLSPRRVRF